MKAHRTAWLALLSLLSTLVVLVSAPVSQAAVTDKCDGSTTTNNVNITSQHGKVFYIDSGQGQNVDASFVSYKITATSAKEDVWVKIGDFVGGVVQLANPLDESMPIGDISANGSKTAFFLLKAPSSSTKAQSHVIRVYSGNPNLTGSQELNSCTYTFSKVSETLKTNSNKVNSVTTTSVSQIGSTMTITVEGNTGIIGAGSSIDGRMIWVSPAARSSWPSRALRLESTSFDLYTNPSKNSGQVSGYPKTNTLYFPISTQDKYYYTAVYTFRIIGFAGSAVAISPIAQISSGTQIKHTDMSGSAITGTTINTTTATISATTSKSLSTSVTYSAGTSTLSYTVTLTNSGSNSIDFDYVTDKPDAELVFKANSAAFNGAAIADPSRSAVDSTQLIFSGPFTVPANSSRTLTYQMQKTSCTSGAYSFSNTADASIGSLRIGASNTTIIEVTATGTCGTTSTSVSTISKTIPLEAITNPATSISTSAATFNAQIDPNGQSGKSIIFEWGTTTALTGTPITLGSTGDGTYSSSSTPYAISYNKTSLSAGTTYYYRINFSGTYGEILSFTTTENAGTPTVATTRVSNISVSGNNVSLTFNGSVDPNQVTNGAKIRYEYALTTTQATLSCTSNIDNANIVSVPSASTYVQTESGESGNNATYADAVYTGSFSTDVAYLDSTGATTITISSAKDKKYCFRIVGYYNSSTADWSTSVTGEWVLFTASVKTAQTITFNTPASIAVGQTVNANATTTASGLAIVYSSNDTSVCTVDSSGVITAVSAGTCSITASQPGNDTYYEADPVTVNFLITGPATTVTDPATMIGSTYATLHGDINPNGNSTTAEFIYCAAGASCSASEINAGVVTVTATQSPVTISKPISYEITSGLTAGTTYYFRAKGTNSAGTTFGEIRSFTTLAISTSSLPDGTIGTSYSATVSAVGGGGTGTYGSWTVSTGSLPDGLSLNASTGELTGTPTAAGAFSFSLTVESNSQTSSARSYTINITAGTPVATTVSANSVTQTGANLRGTINANGNSTTITFEYCESGAGCTASALTTGVTTVNATPSSVTGASNTNVAASIAGLAPSTTYRFRVIASYSSTSTNGAILSFTTDSNSATPPTAITDTATVVSSVSATLNGSINANGATTTVSFEYCESSTNCSASGLSGGTTTVTAAESPITGSSLNTVSFGLSGLSSGTTYFFRVIGTNSVGSDTGTIRSFITLKITTTSLSGGTTSTSYSQSLAATGGNGTYSGWTISTGALPNGLTLNSSSGLISGTPTTAGTFNFSVTVVSNGQTSSAAALSIVISAQSLTVTYDSQGGSSIASGTTTVGGSISSSPGTPTRDGYTFNGWFVAASGGTAITFSYTHGQTSNFTLYAQWTQNTSGGGTPSSDPTPTAPIAPPGPRIDSISKAEICAIGNDITISGNYFDNGSVTFDGTAITVKALSTSSISLSLPKATGGEKTIRVTTPNGTASITITYIDVPKPKFVPTLIPYLSQGEYLSLPATALNATSYSLIGTLPQGLVFDSRSGTIFGTPSENGIFGFVITASGICGETSQVLELDIDKETPNAISHRINILPGATCISDSAKASLDAFLEKVKSLAPRNLIPEIYMSGGGIGTGSDLGDDRRDCLCEVFLDEAVYGNVLEGEFIGSVNRIEIIVYWARP